MKYIDKQPEPASFSAWKLGDDPDWAPSWLALDSAPTVKQELKASLLSEQGAICCYCGIRVTPGNSHIEHLKPRETFHDIDVEYSNLLVSCTVEGKDRHCGSKKDRWYDAALFISPLDIDCEQRFHFLPDGRIAPQIAQDEAAITTITRLGLRSSKLIAHRKNVIEASGIYDESMTDEDLRRWAGAVMQRGPEGNFTEFCFVVSSVLSAFTGGV